MFIGAREDLEDKQGDGRASSSPVIRGCCKIDMLKVERPGQTTHQLTTLLLIFPTLTAFKTRRNVKKEWLLDASLGFPSTLICFSLDAPRASSLDHKFMT